MKCIVKKAWDSEFGQFAKVKTIKELKEIKEQLSDEKHTCNSMTIDFALKQITALED